MLKTIVWLVLQGAIITCCTVWTSQDGGKGLAPGIIGVSVSLMVTGLIVRFSDAWKFGWKASAPPAITKDEKRAGNLTVLKWSALGAGVWLLIFGSEQLMTRDPSGLILLGGAVLALATALYAHNALKATEADQDSHLYMVGDHDQPPVTLERERSEYYLGRPVAKLGYRDSPEQGET